MKTSFETERLLFRELVPEDAAGMFALDSNPEVVRYVGGKPVESIDVSREIIAIIRKQYQENGIGRWAVLLRETGEFIGWAGLKLEKNVNGFEEFYDLGYRFREEFWGKGYGYEAAKAFVAFGFNEMKLPVIYASVEIGNDGSDKILRKCGFRFVNEFDDDGDLCAWYELKNPSA